MIFSGPSAPHLAVPLVVAVLAASFSLPPTRAAQQPTSKVVEFEVASVKPNRSGSGASSTQTPPGRFTATNVSLRQLVRFAYSVQDFLIMGGPDWLDSEKFDVVAKAEDNASPEQLPLMAQHLLTTRFKLISHFDSKELPTYALTVAKGGPRLTPSEIV